MRVQKLKPITPEEWGEVNKINRELTENFLSDSTNLSPKTIKTYRSNLMIFFVWVKDSLNNKAIIDIKPREYLRFQNYLVGRGCSSSDINNKRAAISSLSGYILNFYDDEYPNFRPFITRSVPRPSKSTVHEKRPLTEDEFNSLVEALEEKKEYQKIFYLLFSLDTGCRRNEARQLLREVVNYEPTIKESEGEERATYETNQIRCKGKGREGNQRTFKFGQKTMDALKKWLNTRDDDNKYVFVHTVGGVVKKINESTPNTWCEEFSEILGFRVHPHGLRYSRATMLANQGVDIKRIQKLLSHKSSKTTEIYIIKDENDDLDDLCL